MGKRANLRLAEAESDQAPPGQGEYRVLLLATLITTTRELPVKLRSLSPTGATVEGFHLPAEGVDVILQRGALDAFATVVQSEGRRCMLRFETGLTDEEIRTQIRQARPAPQVAPVDGSDHRRPGFRDRVLTEEEQQAVTEWARPTGRLAYRD